jgi:hypothetical protein
LIAIEPAELSAPIEEWFAYIDRLMREKALRQENPCLLHLIKVLWPRGDRGLRRVEVIERIYNMRYPSGLNMPKKFGATVQSAYNHYCSESDVFKQRGGKPEVGLFYPVGRKGSGYWAVRRDRAHAWLQKRQFDL